MYERVVTFSTSVCSKEPIKKFELIQNSYVPRALRFLVPSRLRETKGLWGRECSRKLGPTFDISGIAQPIGINRLVCGGLNIKAAISFSKTLSNNKASTYLSRQPPQPLSHRQISAGTQRPPTRPHARKQQFPFPRFCSRACH